MPESRPESDRFDTIVIGGGLAGLAAAALCARGGQKVLLLERATTLGGRGATQRRGDFAMNLGPHAFYSSGEGAAVFRELAVPVPGHRPAPSGLISYRDRLMSLPVTPWSLLTARVLSLRGKLEMGRLFSSIERIDPGALHDVSLDGWLTSLGVGPDVADLVRALARLMTYANAPSEHSAGAFLHMFRLAIQAGVLYVDGGWQTLIDGLADAGRAAGVTIETSRKVHAVRYDGGLEVVDDFGVHRATTVIIAATCSAASGLMTAGGLTPPAAFGELRPVRAACLDLALERLPSRRGRFVLGLDRPTYLSAHSETAQLAPEGAALIHVAKYLDPSVTQDPEADRAELEALADLAQPGWRDCVFEQRFLPRLKVASGLERATHGGMPGRPAPDCSDVPGLLFAGDWVGDKGILSNASLASARAAAQLSLARHQRVGRAA